MREDFCFKMFDEKRIDCRICKKKSECKEDKKELEFEMSIW